MGTTTYFGVTYPESTAYVKDGATAMQTIATGFDSAVAIPTYNNQTGTTYTFVIGDAAKTVTSNNASSVTFTIPPQSSVTWATGSTLTVSNLGAGAVTFAGGSGVTVTNTSTTLAQYQTAKIIRTGSDAWTVIIMAGSASPLTKLASGSYSGVSAVNMTNVFSSTYKFYRLLDNHYGSVANYTDYRFRENTTDKATGYFYGGAGGNFNGTSFNPASGGSGTTGFTVSQYGAGTQYRAMMVMDIYRPDATQGVITGVGYGDWDNRAYTLSGRNIAMTNFTGISIWTGTGTMTGDYALYGYN